MKTVEFFNFYYFLYIFIALAFFLGLYFALRKADKKVVFRTISALLFFNLALHFAKLAFSPYREELPTSIRKVTFENICAVSTLIFPFLFLSKNKTARDYMFYLGVLGGIAACFYPTEALNKAPFAFDTIRFYTCHIILWTTPMLMVILGVHKLDYRRIWRSATMFLFVEGLIMVNEIVLTSIGFVSSDLERLLSPDYRNSSFVFGIPSDYAWAEKILNIFVPKIFRVNPLTGQKMYWPLVWLIFPVYIIFDFLFFLMSLIWEFNHFKTDVINLYNTIKKKLAKE